MTPTDFDGVQGRTTPGETLERLIASNSGEVLIVSPFIKVNALVRAIGQLEHDVFIKCVTRWIPEELASGVSDIDVFKVLSSRGNATVHLRQNLHAKYYRRGDRCAIGSANLTGAGMGWRPQSNLEILLEEDRSSGPLAAFEEQVLRGSVKVDEGMYEEMLLLLAELAASAPLLNPPPWHDWLQNHPVDAPDVWLPICRNPEYLYLAYVGDTEQLHSAAKQMAMQDLAVLSPPQGLSEQTFRRSIGLTLLHYPLIKAIDELVIEPQRFGAIRDLLGKGRYVGNPSDAWQTTMRWLLYFLAERYETRTPRHSEVFGRRPNRDRASNEDQSKRKQIQ